jgi:prepilin-type N-terminal cleavage/methylation domain-containing protein
MHTTRSSPRGFTLIELMVSIAAIAVLSLGLAQIFSVAGKTVSAGRRTSTLTQYASALQRQLSEDLSRLTRDGFLVIRNEQLPAPVQGAPGGPRRTRRVDALQFFVTGQFESSRQAVIPGRAARSSEAAIFWGHGLRRQTGAVASLGDDNAQAPYFGESSSRGQVNRYASSWILARQVTLLAQPSESFDDPTAGVTATDLPGGNRVADVVDNDIQIAGQPAARDIFRLPPPAGANEARIVAANTGRDSTNPRRASGLVDIATTDLASIRRTLMYVVPNGGFSIQSPNAGEYFEGPGKREDMQTWMRLALPSDMDGSGVNDRRRPRVEALPPNALGLEWNVPTDAVARADQIALSASAFIPGCTEFIVEWSFGEIDARGRLLWHGHPRDVDLNGDGVINTGQGDYQVLPYDAGATPKFYDRLRTRSGGLVPFAQSPQIVRTDLIHGTVYPTDVTYSYFGLIDPDPAAAGYDLGRSPFIDTNGNGIYEPERGDRLDWPDTVPWPWPKLLRVTVSLADPSDPTAEQRFQFVLPVPQGGASGG